MNAIKTPNITFTVQAARKVWQLLQEEGNLNLNLRIYITGGGCSGFQYGFTFDEIIQTEDSVIEQDPSLTTDAAVGCDQTVRLLIDPMSYQYLKGAEIDFKQDLQGEQFIIRNPNAKTTCGCGSSFAIE